MSQSKKDQLFPIKPHAVSDDELAKIVASALRQDFGEMTSAVKQIGKLTNANLRAIKNWYEARNTPSSGHLLLLARSSPSILKFILMQIGGEDLWDAFRLLAGHSVPVVGEADPAIFSDQSATRNVPLNVPLKSLNERQRWFLLLVRQRQKARAEDISDHFGVAIKTARRDIEGLKGAGRIRFVGAKKTGGYEIIEADGCR